MDVRCPHCDSSMEIGDASQTEATCPSCASSFQILGDQTATYDGSNVDRNLLMGLLGLQMELISQRQLATAMKACEEDRSRLLDEFLVERGDITAESRELLADLFANHLESHDNDVRTGLHALSSMPTARDALAMIRDDETNDIDRTAASNPAEIPSSRQPRSSVGGERFRIIRPHAAGGLGEVFLAHDNELHRDVALKEIKARYADVPTSRLRFLLEAEVTGGLEHPGIVPVYGLGQYSDGRPFYAMRFIRGDNLKQAIDRFHSTDFSAKPAERSVEFRNLVGRMIDVANAIEYAHRRRVLHRDLKPGNIMIGKYGETLVVDWGLAKIHYDDSPSDEPILDVPSGSSDATQSTPGQLLGTPAYASPEQADGRLNEMGATSDVYSLGATLYQILTGESAFTGREVREVVEKVKSGDFRKPTDVDGSIPRALEAVCLKAMALESKDRYRSAAAMAADLELWLADEPVSVFREPIAVRMARWLRRHRTWVAGGATAAVVTLVALTVIAVRERSLRRVAEENLNFARQAVDTMLVEVGKTSLAEIPQMEETRRTLLRKASEFYEAFTTREPEKEDLRFGTALAFMEIGQIHRILGEREQAAKAYDESIERLQQLVNEFDHDPEYKRQLGNAHNWKGVLEKKYDRPAALKLYAVARDLQQGNVRESPDNVEYARELARTHYNRGIVLAETAKVAEAKAEYDASIGILETLIDRPQPLVDECRRDLARAYNDLGKLHDDNATANEGMRRSEAQRLYAQAIEQMKVVASPKREYKEELATYHNNLAVSLIKEAGDLQARGAEQSPLEGLYTEADRRIHESIVLFEELAAPIPSIANELNNAYNTHGGILRNRANHLEDDQLAVNDLNQARIRFELAHAGFRRLVQNEPRRDDYRDRLGMVCCNLGAILEIFGQRDDAVVHLQDACDFHRRLVTDNAGSSEYKVHFWNAASNLARIRAGQGRKTDAIVLITEALRLRCCTLGQVKELATEKAFEQIATDPAFQRLLVP